jgi:hypothetical protein
MIANILQNPKVATHVANARAYHEYISDERSRPVKLLHINVHPDERPAYAMLREFDEVYGDVLMEPIVDSIREALNPIYRDMRTIGVETPEITIYVTTPERDRFYGHFHAKPDSTAGITGSCDVVTYIAPIKITQPVTEKLSVTLTSDYLDILKEHPYNTLEGLVKASAVIDARHVVSDRKTELPFSGNKTLRLRFDARKWFHSVEGFNGGNLFLIVLCNAARSRLPPADLVMEVI